MNKKKTIWVTFQREGIHRYPAAKDIPGVEFLANDHRHIFHFKVQIEVFHDDRDIEFILFKRELESLYVDQTLQMDYKSCEMIASELAEYILNKYPNRSLIVTTSEDQENGATLYYDKETSSDN